LVFPALPDDIRPVLERCLAMVRAPFERATDEWRGGYVVRVGTDRFEIGLRAVFRRCVQLRFRGGRRHRKAALLKALVAKQFRGVLPRLRIQL
jgi:hypothetical protein